MTHTLGSPAEPRLSDLAAVASPAAPRGASRGASRVRVAIVALASLLVAGVLAQLLLVGAALFASPTFWLPHRRLGHAFGPAALAILVLALAGRQPAGIRWRALALVALVAAQMATAKVRGLVGAVHPLNAVAILGVGAALARAARRPPEAALGAG